MEKYILRQPREARENLEMRNAEFGMRNERILSLGKFRIRHSGFRISYGFVPMGLFLDKENMGPLFFFNLNPRGAAGSQFLRPKGEF